MTEKQKKQLRNLLIAALIFVLAAISSMPEWTRFALYLVGYFVAGWEPFQKAAKNIKNGQVFNESFLMSIATIGAFLLGEYLEGIAVMFFYQIGELFQSYAVNQSRKSMTASLKICAEKEEEAFTAAEILELAERASSQKAKIEEWIARFARYYTPIVVMAAAVLAVIPPLFLPDYPFAEWIKRALTFLVVSSPCGLVLSISLSFFGGIGTASKYGILVKGSSYLELLSKAELVVFDKTGTLTEGTLRVGEVVSERMTQEDLLGIAAYAEAYSSHPIAQSIAEAYGKPIDTAQIHEVQEIAGRGIWANVGEIEVYVGNAKWMQEAGIEYPKEVPAGTIVYVAVDHVYVGYLRIADAVKPDAKTAMENLKKMGIKKTVMLTGDSDAIGRRVAEKLGMDEVYTQLLPEDKVERVESLLERKSRNTSLIFVGDGSKDAAALTRSDVGVAMGSTEMENADIIIMTDEPSKLAEIIAIARKTMKLCGENIALVLGIKAVILLLGAFGIADVWAAVFSDVGAAVLAILNSMRTLYVKKKQ